MPGEVRWYRDVELQGRSMNYMAFDTLGKWTLTRHREKQRDEWSTGVSTVGINPSAPPAKQEEIKVGKEIVRALNLLQVPLHGKAQELQIFPS